MFCIFRYNRIFRHIFVSTTYIYRQSSGIVIFLCKNYMSSYLRYIDRLLDEVFLSPAVTLSELYEEPRKKYWVTEKVHRKLFVRHIIILAVIFYCFFVYSLSLSIFSLLRFYVEKIFCSGKQCRGWRALPSSSVYGPA